MSNYKGLNKSMNISDLGCIPDRLNHQIKTKMNETKVRRQYLVAKSELFPAF